MLPLGGSSLQRRSSDPSIESFCLIPKTDADCPLCSVERKVSRLINAAGTLFRRTLLMTLYGTGMRRSELAHLKVGDIDSQRMIIRVVAGKGGKDRDLPLGPTLLETLREYWRWRKPKIYLFPTRMRRVKRAVPHSIAFVRLSGFDSCRGSQHCTYQPIKPGEPKPVAGVLTRNFRGE